MGMACCGFMSPARWGKLLLGEGNPLARPTPGTIARLPVDEILMLAAPAW